jgi:hypothetical protein
MPIVHEAVPNNSEYLKTIKDYLFPMAGVGHKNVGDCFE